MALSPYSVGRTALFASQVDQRFSYCLYIPQSFREEGEKAATMTVTFKASAAPEGGKVNLAGTYKMSVCSDANCQIETTAIALAVPITK